MTGGDKNDFVISLAGNSCFPAFLSANKKPAFVISYHFLIF